ncbi:hypothetical protein [Sulfobacillus harzensis]|uniref:DUF4405 domain-containing protein n=1 Tax=Sulfobacillus harzensis TaxID=2729629 RepID=A0A7Y0Q384_9FIRM|nr:hypothetical protein [Sulfobacillus harzensis]NMP21934.1 hypothetical protein [Sulfobacillus harzensis]
MILTNSNIERRGISAERANAINRKRLVVLRNERLTALAAAVLLVLFLIDLVFTADLRKFILVHIFIGTLLAGPLVVKLASVGYRFFSYYSKSPAFVEKGPPNIWLRLLAPFLILLTATLFLSGLALALEGAPDNRLVFLIHAGSAALWLPLIVVHVYAHIRLVPRSLRKEWSQPSGMSVSGRVKRLRTTVISLIIGAIAAILLTAASTPWLHAPIQHGIPSPIILGVVVSIVGLFIAVPLLRNARD